MCPQCGDGGNDGKVKARCDQFSEELVRLDTHLAHAGELVAASGAVGRKLDFVIQEIGRELNTIASKSQDAGVAALVIDAKAELERMREQAQNVE